MKQKIFLVAGFGISVACLYWIFKDISFSEFAGEFRSFNFLWLIPSLFFFYWSLYLRSVRWGFFFRPSFQLSGRRLFRPLMIGFAFNNILPSGRVGEFVRAFYVGRKEKTGLPMALATVFTERIFDGLTLLVCIGVALIFLPPIDPSQQVVLWDFEVSGEQIAPLMRKVIIGCVALVVIVVTCMIPAVQRAIVRVIRALPGLPVEIKDRLVEFAEGVIKGFESVRGFKNIFGITGYSFAVWGLIGLSVMSLGYGFSGMSMSYFQAMALVGICAVFVVIPAAPGYWGLYEVGFVLGLKLLGIGESESDSTATAFAILVHLVQYVPIVAVGLLFAYQSQVSVGRMQK